MADNLIPQYRFDDSKDTHRIGVKKNKFTRHRDPEDNVKEFDLGTGVPEEKYGKDENRITDDSASYEGEPWFISKSFNDYETNKRPLHPVKDYLNPKDKHTGDDHLEMGKGNYYPEYKVSFDVNPNTDSVNYNQQGNLNSQKKHGEHLKTTINEENATDKHIYNINKTETIMGNLTEQINRMKQIILFQEGMSYQDIKNLTEQKEKGDGDSGGAEGGESTGESLMTSMAVLSPLNVEFEGGLTVNEPTADEKATLAKRTEKLTDDEKATLEKRIPDSDVEAEKEYLSAEPGKEYEAEENVEEGLSAAAQTYNEMIALQREMEEYLTDAGGSAEEDSYRNMAEDLAAMTARYSEQVGSKEYDGSGKEEPAKEEPTKEEPAKPKAKLTSKKATKSTKSKTTAKRGAYVGAFGSTATKGAGGIGAPFTEDPWGAKTTKKKKEKRANTMIAERHYPRSRRKYSSSQSKGPKVIKLKESDLYRIVERVLSEKKRLR